MATATICDPCSRKDKTSSASKHCTDCEENLCSECIDTHNTFKAFLKHHVVPLNLVSGSLFNINKLCAKHDELPYELFCSDHDVLCCRACMTESHRSCEKLSPIEIASKGVRSSSMYESISKRVEYLKVTGHQVTEEMKSIESDLKESKVSALEKLSRLKEVMLKRICEIYDKTVSEINYTCTSLQEKVQTHKNSVVQRVQNTEEIAKKLGTVSAHGSETQIFLLLNLLKFDISNAETDLGETVSSLKFFTVNFTETDLKSSLKSLGDVTVKEQDSSVHFKLPENQGAQLQSQYNFAPIAFRFEKKISYNYKKSMCINGMCVTRDNQLILCSSYTNSLIILTSDCQYVRGIELKFYPWNVAIEPETGDAWVTMPNSSFVQVVDTKSMSLQRQVNVVNGAYGITFVGKNFAVGVNNGKVKLFNKLGEHLKTFQCHMKFIYSLCYSFKEDIIYCCAADDNNFFGINTDGTNVFTHIQANLSGPIGSTTDPSGNVYVVCYQSKNLHKFTSKGEFVTVMLDNKAITDVAYAAAFNKDCSKFYVAYRDKTDVSVFSCK